MATGTYTEDQRACICSSSIKLTTPKATPYASVDQYSDKLAALLKYDNVKDKFQ